ncbi:hypothetical protein [Billgrantia antri]|uniref:hypothetical protein n=1 Tax=Billgrantia antri TaxID=2846777 RepID=UPI003B219FA2
MTLFVTTVISQVTITLNLFSIENREHEQMIFEVNRPQPPPQPSRLLGQALDLFPRRSSRCKEPVELTLAFNHLFAEIAGSRAHTLEGLFGSLHLLLGQSQYMRGARVAVQFRWQR